MTGSRSSGFSAASRNCRSTFPSSALISSNGRSSLAILSFRTRRKAATTRSPTPAGRKRPGRSSQASIPPERTGVQLDTKTRAKPARAVEKELMQILLAEPGLVGQAYVEVRPEEIEHPGLQQLLGGLYRLHEAAEEPTLDGLRDVIENAALIDWAMDQQEVGRSVPDRETWFRGVLERFRAERVTLRRKQLMDRLRAATEDGERQRLLQAIQDLDRRPGDSPGRSP